MDNINPDQRAERAQPSADGPIGAIGGTGPDEWPEPPSDPFATTDALPIRVERGVAVPLFPYATTEPETTDPDTPAAGTTKSWLIALVAGLAGALALAGILWAAGTFDSDQPRIISDSGGDIIEIVTSGEQTIASAVARKVVPSIVTVDVGEDDGGAFDLFASGSGVVLTADGLIVTNQHVIESADRVRVVFSDGRIYEAEIIGGDRRTDLAVLRVATTGLTPIEFGSTDDAEIGDVAIAVGSPLGLDGGPSLTVGVISAFGRRVSTGLGDTDILFDMLQTDAPITQGSSGGALVDENGRLLGITSAIGVSSAGAEGIGFAIPSELVTRVTDEIVESGFVQHAFLGVTLAGAFNEGADGAQIPAGAIVDSFAVDPSAAEMAGIEVGDRIIGYNDSVVDTREDLISGLRRLHVGDVVTLEVVRGSETLEIDVALAARPDDI